MWDFLFTYYSLRPRQLRRWHPGFGVVLEPAGRRRRYLDRTGYDRIRQRVTVGREHLRSPRRHRRFIADCCAPPPAAPPGLNCFGLHEWAMVYRSPTSGTTGPSAAGRRRHRRVVESMPLRCTHFDAYRFFTEPAAPRNAERADAANR